MVKGTANFKAATTEIEKQHALNIHQILFNMYNFNARRDIEIMSNVDLFSQEISIETNNFAVTTFSFFQTFTITRRDGTLARREPIISLK